MPTAIGMLEAPGADPDALVFGKWPLHGKWRRCMVRGVLTGSAADIHLHHVHAL